MVPTKIKVFKSDLNYTNVLFITSKYGPRDLSGHAKFHHGIDISDARVERTKEGFSIPALIKGYVKKIKYSSGSGGNYVDVMSLDDIIRLRTYHLNKILVTKDQKTDLSTIIGTMGNSGLGSLGVHQHIEVFINETEINPMNFVDVYSKILTIKYRQLLTDEMLEKLNNSYYRFFNMTLLYVGD